MKRIFDLIFGRKLRQETDRYLEQLARAPIEASRRSASELLARLQAGPGPKVRFGQTLWGEPVMVPLEEILQGHGLVTGGTGAGKTAMCLLLVKGLISFSWG